MFTFAIYKLIWTCGTCCKLCHRIQSLFNSLGDEVKGKTIGLGGDGRYFNKQAAQIIIKMAAANGVKKASSTVSLHSAKH